MCNGQRLVKSLQIVMMSFGVTHNGWVKRIQVKGNCWVYGRLQKNPTFFVYASRNEEIQDKQQEFLSLYPIFFDYSLGGYSHRERWSRTRWNEVINYASKEKNYRAYIGANYRLPYQTINIWHCYALIHSHREGFASSRARTTQRFWVMK
jgi:hypothetical protein